MSIRTIHELPSELPHAHLYLDDIEKISKILLKAYAPCFRERKKEAKIVYTVGDPRMDSIGDLETHGGTTADLSIGVDRFTRVAFRSGLDPQIHLYSLDEQQCWALYAKIKSIFDRRQLRTKNTLFGLPGWLKVSFWLLAPVGILSFGLSILRASNPGLWPSLGYWVGYVLLLSPLIFETLRPSRVSFVRSYESSKASRSARKSYIRDLVFLVLGALVGQLIRRLFK